MMRCFPPNYCCAHGKPTWKRNLSNETATGVGTNPSLSVKPSTKKGWAAAESAEKVDERRVSVMRKARNLYHKIYPKDLSKTMTTVMFLFVFPYLFAIRVWDLAAPLIISRHPQ